MLLKPFSMGKRVSLVDIARATGFAISTVSMALRNDASIPAATRKRIDTASRELGYYPNPLLAALASKQFSSKQMGGTPIALIRRPEKSQDDEILIQKIIEAQKDHARKFGYRLEAFRTDGFTDGKQATRVLFSRGFQGILLDTHFRLDLLPGMDWSRFSVVGWGGSTAKSYDSSPPLISLRSRPEGVAGNLEAGLQKNRLRSFRFTRIGSGRPHTMGSGPNLFAAPASPSSYSSAHVRVST
jgi:DNA-binding LacI/PurR family transcriptional regulator